MTSLSQSITELPKLGGGEITIASFGCTAFISGN